MFRTRVLVTCVAAAASVVSLIPAAPAAAQSSSRTFVRGVYGRDSSPGGVSVIKGTGFDTVTVQPWKEDLDKLHAAGMKGIVWLWGYESATCSFAESDQMIREVVEVIKGHPAIAAYQVADEPNYAPVESGCRNVPGQIRARSDLIKSIDPTKPTYTVISTWDGREVFPYQYFAGTTDIMGLDVYPCGGGRAECQMNLIDQAIAEADKDGVKRYWAVLQDFADGYYRHQSAAELDEQFDRWAKSRMEGYFVYHWNYGNIESKPDHLATLARHNAAYSLPAPTPTPAPTTTTPAPTPSPTASAPAVTPAPGGTTGIVPGEVAAPSEDRQAPSAPRSLFAVPTKTGTDLSWLASSDDRGVAGYAVWRDGRRIARTADSSFSDETNGRSHVYAVRAFDAAGNYSEAATVRVSSWRRGTTARQWLCVVAGLRRLGIC